MRRQLCWAGGVLLAMCAAAAEAQNPKPDVSGSTIVVEGCLQNGDQSGSPGRTPLGAAATPGNAGNIANNPELPPYFILTDARPAGRTTPGNTGIGIGTAGAARTRNADGTVTSEPSGRDSPKTYTLVGNHTEFATHRGHRVEVTGSIAPAMVPGERRPDLPGRDPQAGDNGAAGGTLSPQANNSQGAAAFQAGAERLNVTSMRRLADSCSR